MFFHLTAILYHYICDPPIPTGHRVFSLLTSCLIAKERVEHQKINSGLLFQRLSGTLLLCGCSAPALNCHIDFSGLFLLRLCEHCLRSVRKPNVGNPAPPNLFHVLGKSSGRQIFNLELVIIKPLLNALHFGVSFPGCTVFSNNFWLTV